MIMETTFEENEEVMAAGFDSVYGAPGSGAPGKDGREVELQRGETALQWRYVGDDSWTDLVSLEELEGDPGAQGPAGSDATVTAENIKNALGFAPASSETVEQLSEEIANQQEGLKQYIDEQLGVIENGTY